MTCAETIHRILEADPSDLKGHGGGALAEHIRTCSRCRAMAEAVLEEEHRLGVQMTEAVGPPDLHRLLDEAFGDTLETASGKATAPISREKTTIPLRRMLFPLFPLGAAAALVALFLGGQPSLPGDPYTPPQRTAGLGLEVPEGQNAAVLATNDPNITVLWFF